MNTFFEHVRFQKKFTYHIHFIRNLPENILHQNKEKIQELEIQFRIALMGSS